eukprot:10407697-Prorocentrum_lima.AAC.1
MDAHADDRVGLTGSSARERTLTPRPGKGVPLSGPLPPALPTSSMAASSGGAAFAKSPWITD